LGVKKGKSRGRSPQNAQSLPQKKGAGLDLRFLGPFYAIAQRIKKRNTIAPGVGKSTKQKGDRTAKSKRNEKRPLICPHRTKEWEVTLKKPKWGGYRRRVAKKRVEKGGRHAKKGNGRLTVRGRNPQRGGIRTQHSKTLRPA